MDNGIRKARPDDAGGCARVHSQAWQETYTGLVAPEYLAGRTEEYSLRLFHNNGCRDMFVAVEDGEIVGFSGLAKTQGPDAGEIQAVYVLKKAQGRGLGRALLDKALEELKARGFTKAVLWVLSTNEKAIGFYEHVGLTFNGAEKEETLGTPVVERQYEKAL